MENDSLSESRKISSTNSFIDNQRNKTTELSRSKKRLYTFTNMTRSNVINKGLKQVPLSRNTDKRISIFSNIHNYNKSANRIKNLKMNIHSNISPTMSTYENDKEITNNITEQEKMKSIHQKIYKFYNSYYKAKNTTKNKIYENEVSKANNHKKVFFSNLSPSKESIKRKQLLNKEKFSRSIETKSKTSNIKSRFQPNILHSPNKMKRRASYTFRKSILDSPLLEKVLTLVKEMDKVKKKENYIPKTKLKGGRVKLVSLLNKKKGIINENIYFASKKKITKGVHNMLAKKPTNNIEMNKLIINSFGIGHNHVEFSKKLYDLNEVFFSLLETMKQKRSEIDIARFEKEKRKYTDPSDYKDYHKINFELINQLNNRDKWGQKFMLEQYQYKIPEKEFQKFKKSEKQKYKEKATNTAKKVSSLILNLDADEYEPADDVTHNYRSTKSNISSINFKRIIRLLKILKYQEDEEQTGYIAIKPDFLRKEQRLIENEMLNIIGKSGKPRFVKNILKPKTVDKYKSISGDYFGLPV